jgi:RHS repeat-associated protein
LPTANGFEREYFLSDHLGNTRVVFKKSGDSALIVQENHYYAYGMEISDQSFSSTAVPNTFLYNGKEYDTNTGYYQYGFRQYDAQIGRWHSEVSEQVVVDAMSEQSCCTSSYA